MWRESFLFTTVSYHAPPQTSMSVKVHTAALKFVKTQVEVMGVAVMTDTIWARMTDLAMVCLCVSPTCTAEISDYTILL